MPSRLPSLKALTLIAKTDGTLYESIMDDIGLPVTGITEQNPIGENAAKVESVRAVASFMAESPDDRLELPPELDAIRRVSEALGYIVNVDQDKLGLG